MIGRAGEAVANGQRVWGSFGGSWAMGFEERNLAILQSDMMTLPWFELSV